MNNQTVIDLVSQAAGSDAVRTDDEALALAGSDVHLTGNRPLAVVRPPNAEIVAKVVRIAVEQKCAVLPRGGGLSYTGGYITDFPRSITLDLGGLDKIVSLSEEDMLLTVEAGVTWKQVYEELKPRGLRLPFFGTFSGAGATIGGGLSHGALFFGSARYGTAADIVLGLQVALADGQLLRTGQGSVRAESKPFSRNFGPDLTGLFCHDGGAFGIKTQATFRMMRSPENTGYASFAFADMESASDALSEIAREDLAEEVYILDPAVVGALNPSAHEMKQAVSAVVKESGGFLPALSALFDMAKGGKKFIPEGHFSLHLTAAGRSASGVKRDLDAANRIATGCGGKKIAATVPRSARATLFSDLNGVLGEDGGRWAALNAKVAHSDARKLITSFEDMMAPHRARMAELGVTNTLLGSALGAQSFSFEPVFRWYDEWLPIHKQVPDPDHLARLSEPAANPDARELVNELRQRTVELFRDLGASSNQIGRSYPFLSALSPDAAGLLKQVKSTLDPDGLINPGVLEFGN